MAEHENTLLVRARSALLDVAGDCGPEIVATIFPHLIPLMLGAGVAVSWANHLSAEAEAARVAGLARQLQRVRQRVHRLRQEDPPNLARALVRPDIVFILQTARDHFAVHQFESRLHRFAEVVARRVVEPEREFEPDLDAARAALDVTDLGVLFLVALAKRAAQNVGLPGVVGAGNLSDPTSGTVGGETSATMLFQAVPEACKSREAVAAGLSGLQSLERHVLAVRTTAMGGRLHVPCADGSIAVAGDDAWLVTSRGIDFVANIHARAEELRSADRPA